MVLQIAEVLDAELLEEARLLGLEEERFTGGAATAGWHARQHKNNLQARSDKVLARLLGRVETALLAHEMVQAAARPKRIIHMLFSRYDAGMEYGTHTDDALMQGQRSDLSFTLFLSPGDAYRGGALVIDDVDAEKSFRPDAGSLLLYPSTSLHRVEPVTDGSRLAIVGWIRSYVRSREAREILFDLERAIFRLRRDAGEQQQALDLLLKSRSNLLRLWAED